MRDLQSQIAVTPAGVPHGLEKHLGETRAQAEGLRGRGAKLGEGGDALLAGLGLAETVTAQALALSKRPLDLLRGSGSEEQLLKNAKDAGGPRRWRSPPTRRSSSWPSSSGTTRPRGSAPAIRGEEERMLDPMLKVIPS